VEATAVRNRSTVRAGRWQSGVDDGDYRVLYDTVSRLAGLRDIEEVAQLVVERARALLKTDLAFVALRGPQDKVLHMLTCVGHRSEEFMGLARPIEQGIAVFERRPMYSADFLNDNRLSHHPDTDARVRAEGIRSVLVVPLAVLESTIGMLAVANRSVYSFSEREVRLLSELAAHAALALDNARSHAEAVSAAARADAVRARTEQTLLQVERLQVLHDAMIEALLRGHGIGGVLSVLREAFGVAVIATDWRNVVLAHSGAEKWLDSKGMPARGLLLRAGMDRPLSDPAPGDQPVVREGSIVIRMATADESLGHLWVPAIDEVGERGLLVAAVQRAARVLALELIRSRVALEAERRLGRDLLLNLLSDTPADPAVQESLARQVWRGYGAPHRPLTIRVGREQPTPTSQLERARRLIAEGRPGDLVAVHRGELVMMLGEVDRRRTDAEVARIRSRLAAHGLEASIVIGTPCRNLAQDRDCTLACLHLHELLGWRPVMWLEELEPLTILFESNEHVRLTRFVHSVLGPVADRPELLATLHAYYAAGRNRAEAARRLNVHINTLRYRLWRIETLLVGQSIEDPAKEAAVQLAVAIHGGHLAAPGVTQAG
jgi:GAF domain/PucR C-terminal helix-turn-helix domain